MRRTRPLILILIALIVGIVGVTYVIQKAAQARRAPQPPDRLPESVSARADDWRWSHSEGNRTVIEVIAKNFATNASGSKFDLEGVELHLFHKDGKAYDLVRSAKAEFQVAEGILFSEGAVEITMGVPADPKAVQDPGRVLRIQSSGVKFESKTGKAFTDKPAQFSFGRGEGSSTGADYDPASRELHMHSDVKLKWRATQQGDPDMDIEAGSLAYNEANSRVILTPWAKFRRGGLSLDAGGSVVALDKGVITGVEALEARGGYKYPTRQIDYAANRLVMKFGEKNTVNAITGEGGARLVSTSATANTTVNSNRLDMEFETAGNDSVLRFALAMGKSSVESRPVIRPNVPPPDTRLLKSEIIKLFMRPGGEEMDRVETDSPGTIDFLPNRPGQKKRTLEAAHMRISYGAENQIRTFEATTVATRTDTEPVKGKAMPPALTWSKALQANFDEKTGDMSRLEQWDDFRYQEGARQAKSQRAVLESSRDLITLSGAARVWDPGGSTAGDSIHLHQKTSDFEAEGNVTSTRVPEKKKDNQRDGLLAGDDPIQAKAARMTSTGDNRRISYEGNALLWQGANRLQADRVDIDRTAGGLVARGSVSTQLLDKPKPPDPAKPRRTPAAPVYTVVKAPRLDYDDQARLAHYTGGVVLNRPGLVVNSKELRAFLSKAEGDTSLEKAVADGAVKIVQTAPDRMRTGTSEHAEYYTGENKVILSQGQPQLLDTVRGVTRGTQLTYWAENDKLLVEGAADQPVKSRILRR